MSSISKATSDAADNALAEEDVAGAGAVADDDEGVGGAGTLCKDASPSLLFFKRSCKSRRAIFLYVECVCVCVRSIRTF